MSWLSRLFGGGKEQEPAAPAPTAEIEHRGFTVRAEPYKSEGGQYQVAGTVLKEIDGEQREHSFVRADRLASLEDATAMSLQKGRQIVDEQGERVFKQPSAKRS
ncbi:HlyU family transcriptional regulator [Enterovirga sp. CN4-39]|uniref:HlyU family transcriptional regulator n=1 Tax=Enterovirga sp. CN4-39 TaxID=3400910 RepID=UPI003C11BAE2